MTDSTYCGGQQSALCPWILHLWIPTTENRKYSGKKNSRKFHKPELEPTAH